MSNERRHDTRLKAIDLLDYILIDKDGVRIDFSMGRTLDISENGMLMETNKDIPINHLILVTLDLDENLIRVKGKVMHSHTDAGRYQIGIKFFDISRKHSETFHQYIEAFQSKFSNNQES